MKIACFHLNQIGDLLFSLPALKCLKDWKPDVKIISVARPACSVLLERTGLPDRIIVRRSGLNREKLQMLAELRREKIDTTIMFSQSFEPALLGLLSGAGNRCGFKTPKIDWLYTNYIDIVRPPSIKNNLNLLGSMGCPISCDSYLGLIHSTEEDRRLADQLLANEGEVSGRIIVLAPGTSSRRSVKAWIEQEWADIIEHYSSHCMTPLIVGTDDVSDILSRTSVPVINLSRKTSLPVLLALLQRAEVVVGVDSGVLHLAAAVGAKVVGLYGMSDPTVTGPHGEGHAVVRAEVECSPCQLSVCPFDKKCMSAINSKMVIEAIDSILSKSRQGSEVV